MNGKNVPLTEIRSVVKIGHSHLISIPAIFCRANAIEKGLKLILEVHPDKIIIRPPNYDKDIQPDARATKILLEPSPEVPKSKYERTS